ncbi:proline-rich receptor-like protein kinase [Ancistrocladus abbreviatus]
MSQRSNWQETAHPGNRTPVSTVGGYYDTTTPDAPLLSRFQFNTYDEELQGAIVIVDVKDKSRNHPT